MARRIVFVNPPLTLRERYGRLYGAGSVAPPLGLLYLASSVRQEGYEPLLLDAAVFNWNIWETAERILDFRPDFVGFTASFLSLRYAAMIAKEIRKRNKGIVLILGGPQVTAVPEEIIGPSDFDWYVIGEGEKTLTELLNHLSQEKRAEDILGIGFFRNGKAVVNPPRPLIEELDSLPPPAFDLVPDFRLYEPSGDLLRDIPNGTLITSRGCPLTCAFCDRSVFGNRWRFHSARYVVDMMKTLHDRYGVKDITIWDDNFLVDKRRIIEMCDLLIEAGMDLTYSCQSSVNFAREEVMPKLNASGCWLIGWGLESGSQDILSRYEKHIQLEQSRRAVAMAQKAGIQNDGYFIFGNPGETLRTIQETLNFIHELKLDHIQVHPLTPLPNTRFYEESEKKGAFTRHWRTTGFIEVSYVPEGLTVRQIESACRKAYRIVYFNPRNFLRLLGRLFNFRRPRVVIKLLKSAFALLSYMFLQDRTREGICLEPPSVVSPQERLDFPSRFV